MTLAEIRSRVDEYGAQYITVTGGEPLVQPHCLDLLTDLCDAGYSVSLETSGALDISRVDPRVMQVVDMKTPGSGESARNLYQNIDCLKAGDQLKFVICDEADYLWARGKITQYRPDDPYEILFSPMEGSLEAATLADWILRDHLQVRFQIQLHKYLWGDVSGK